MNSNLHEGINLHGRQTHDEMLRLSNTEKRESKQERDSILFPLRSAKMETSLIG